MTKRPRRPTGPSKKPNVVWTDSALRDLERIDSYIAADNPLAAEKWIQKLIAAGQAAAMAPMAGRMVPEMQQ
jgi:plasmid stabilization system protein ParE